jgi:hypothetical protein
LFMNRKEISLDHCGWNWNIENICIVQSTVLSIVCRIQINTDSGQSVVQKQDINLLMNKW